MRAASWFCVALAAVDAFSPSRPTRPLSPQQRRRSVVVAGGSILPPKLREYGTYGLVAYGFVELAWWGAPCAVAYQTLGAPPASLAELLEAGKPAFLAAVLLWPNSWFRNGVAARGAELLRDAAAR